MKALRWSLGVLGMMASGALGGCGGQDTPSIPQDGGSGGGIGGHSDDGAVPDGEGGIENPCGSEDSSLKKADAAQLFGASKIPTFDLYLPEAAWRDLKANARLEEYVPAQACFEGKAVGLVGLRFKGSYGSLYNCFDASGHNTCRKLGMKLKFDEYVEDQRFYGLKRLNFQGYRYDDTYLKERLSYDLYAAMNVVAPRAAWALVRVNGDPQGLFGMVEQIDGRFTQNRWPDEGNGNLYKEIWPGQISDSWIREHLETNKDAGDIRALTSFSEALNSASNEQLRTVLAQHMDLDYLARYMAVDDAIANFDGITTYYTSGAPDEAGNHNFYLYEQAGAKFTLVPWDLESTLSLSSNFGGGPPWQTLPADCSLTYPVWGGDSKVIAPGCDRVFRALAADLAAYRVAARQLLDGPFAQDRMLANIDTLAAFIRSEAVADPHGPGGAAFDGAVSYMKQEIPKLRARLEHLLSGAPSTPLRIDPDVLTTFDDADDYGITDGTMQMSNANTVFSVALNTTEPIEGAKTLRITFDFGNEVEPWNQWMFYSIPVTPTPRDLSHRTGLRFKVRADQPRGVRVNLDSPHNSASEEGIQVGWDINATTTSSSVSLLLADAKVASWATDPGDNLNDILATITGLRFQPECNNRGSSGQLPEGTRDKGWVEVDALEFF